MTTDQLLWVLARVAGLASYGALAIALVTGIALRTAVFDWLGSNRAVRSLHEYTTVLWIPLVIVTVTAYLKRRMSKELWLWVHRLAYLAFALAFLHAVLSGTDFSDPVVSAITWGTAAALLTLTVARLLGGRLPA